MDVFGHQEQFRHYGLTRHKQYTVEFDLQHCLHVCVMLQELKALFWQFLQKHGAPPGKKAR